MESEVFLKELRDIEDAVEKREQEVKDPEKCLLSEFEAGRVDAIFASLLRNGWEPTSYEESYLITACAVRATHEDVHHKAFTMLLAPKDGLEVLMFRALEHGIYHVLDRHRGEETRWLEPAELTINKNFLRLVELAWDGMERGKDTNWTFDLRPFMVYQEKMATIRMAKRRAELHKQRQDI